MNTKTSLKQFVDQLKSVDEVIITIVCCDSRVRFPYKIVNIQDSFFAKNKEKSVVFVPIPIIGGGAPSKLKIRKIKKVLIGWGVDRTKIRILVTQHGDSQEIDSLSNDNNINENNFHINNAYISCGLRKFFLSNASKLQQLHGLLRRYSEMKKRATGDKSFAPDRQDLDFLKSDCPDIMALVNAIHESTGPDGKRIPRRLLIRAAYRNSSFEIAENTSSVAMKISEFLKEPENDDIYPTCAVYEGVYDHQKKNIKFATYANIGDSLSLEFEDMAKRTDTIQDPENAVIVYGGKAILYPIELMIENISNKPDNYFRSIATTPMIPHLLCAFAEISYAVIHHNFPHKGDRNFASLKKIIVVCENENYFHVLESAIKSREWINEYQNIFKYFVNKFEVIILEQNGKISPTKKELAIH